MSGSVWLYSHIERFEQIIGNHIGKRVYISPAPNQGMLAGYSVTVEDGRGYFILVDGLPIESLEERAINAFMKEYQRRK